MTLRLINFVSFYIGWVVCVAGAGRGMTTLGPAVVGALLVLHLILSPHATRDALLIATVGLLGWTVDTTQAVVGIFSFGRLSPAPWLCPLWLVAVWMIFATTLTSSLRWLTGRYALAALFGAAGGPLSYYYGLRLGAIEFNPNTPLTLIALALVWAAVMPLLIWLARALVPIAPNHAPAPVPAAISS
jgi:hypothetical protein